MADTWLTPKVKERLSKMSRAELDAELAKLNKLLADAPEEKKVPAKKKEAPKRMRKGVSINRRKARK
jgi:hypothetical protein